MFATSYQLRQLRSVSSARQMKKLSYINPDVQGLLVRLVRLVSVWAPGVTHSNVS